jgi:DNA-binding transcriptional ArsR family regulator
MPADPDPRLPPDEATRLFGLLADETRLRLLLALEYAGAEGIPPVGLAEALGMTPESVGYHLAVLRLAGVVAGRREGKSVFYALAPSRARDLLLRHVRP